MSAPATDRLYHLLPAIYRQRDADQGQPLRALLAVIEGELLALESDIAGLYANWFIETCAEWVVPYIGDLLAAGATTAALGAAHSQRALVANTIAYRRRKGVAAILERAAQDASGWPARAVESFALLGATQHVQHLRPGRGALADVRAAPALAELGGPFEQIAHTVDTRNATPFANAPDVLAARRGGFNLPIVRLFLWRVQSYALDGAVAGAPDNGRPGQYTIHPFGLGQPLFNRPQPIVALTDQAQPVNLPTPLTLPLLAADLQAYVAQYGALPPEQQPPASNFYGPGRALQVVKDGAPVPPKAVVASDLGAWAAPAAGTVAVDSRTGRVAFAPGEAPAGPPVVSACYGFSADRGGGPYDRRASMAGLTDAAWAAIVASPDLPAPNAPAGVSVFPTLGAALTAWAASGGAGVIQIADSGLYVETLAPLALPAGAALTIQAANGARPALRLGGDLVLQGGGSAASLTLNGLLLDGGVTIHGSLALDVAHCTLLPHGLTFADGEPTALRVAITNSLVGPLLLPADTAALTVQDSIVDGSATGYAVAAGAADAPPGPPLAVSNATLFGRAVVRELIASNTIFVDPVLVQRRQLGSLRFCYVPDGSATPRRYRCQPDLALQDLATQGLTGAALAQAEGRLQTRLRPVFASRRFGDPAFAQFDATCAAELSSGADDGSAMGVFHSLQEPARAANLRARLDEYLRAGLDAGIAFVT